MSSCLADDLLNCLGCLVGGVVQLVELSGRWSCQTVELYSCWVVQQVELSDCWVVRQVELSDCQVVNTSSCDPSNVIILVKIYISLCLSDLTLLAWLRDKPKKVSAKARTNYVRKYGRGGFIEFWTSQMRFLFWVQQGVCSRVERSSSLRNALTVGYNWIDWLKVLVQYDCFLQQPLV